MFLLFLCLYLTLVHGKEEDFVPKDDDGQAEAALEKALGEMRSRVVSGAGEMATFSARRPEPPVAPPRASGEQMIQQNLTSSSLAPLPILHSSALPILPATVLINPARIEIPKPRNPALANFIVRPNEPKRLHKFEFMPHFDKENYDFMVPEGPPVQADSLVAVLTFFGHLQAEVPRFEIKLDRLGWFGIGEVTTVQETNYALSEVPIQRRASANISWSDTEEGIYRFQVQAVQGQLKSSTEVRVEILPVRNYTHLEMEPTSTAGEEAETGKTEEGHNLEEETTQFSVDLNVEDGSALNGTTEELGQKTAEELGQKGAEELGQKGAEKLGQKTAEELGQKEMDELLQMDPLGIDEFVANITMEDEKQAEEEIQLNALLAQDWPIALGQGNLSIRVLLNGQPKSSGRVEVDFAELSALRHRPIASLEVELLDEDGQSPNAIVRLELRSANPSILDIRPHFLAPGDRARLWLSNPKKLAEMAAEKRGWAEQFKLFAHLADESKEEGKAVGQALPLFSGQFGVKGGPLKAPRFEGPPEGYEFAISEAASHGHVLGGLELAKMEEVTGPIAFSLFGQGTELFRVGQDGLLRLDCHRQNATFKAANGTMENASQIRCLDTDLGQPSVLYFVANAKLANSTGPSSSPVPITVHVEDANDNPPRLQLFHPAGQALTILDGQLERGPLILAIIDADSSPQNRANRLQLEGNCSEMFISSQLDNNSTNSSAKFPLFSVDLRANALLGEWANGCGHLELVARDNDGQEDRKRLEISVKHKTRQFRFGQELYERTMPLERMQIGTPIVQMQLAQKPAATVPNYVLVGGNPGWLAIEPFSGNVFVSQVPSLPSGVISLRVAAFDRESRLQLAQSTLRLEIPDISGQAHSHQHVHFPSALIQRELAGVEESEELEESGTALWMPLFEDAQLAEHVKLVDVQAWDSAGRTVKLAKDCLLYTPANGSLRLDLASMARVRSVHAQFSLDQAGKEEDKALLALTLRSDPAKAEARRRRLARPKFVAPWEAEESLIRLKIAEEMPIGRAILRLPAFNPLTGAPVQLQLEGPNADSFSLDAERGELRIARRLDFEASARFQLLSLVAASPEGDRPVRAQLQVELLDVDDVPPSIRLIPSKSAGKAADQNVREIVRLRVEENAPAGTEMALVEVEDPDSRKHKCELVGKEAGKFTLQPAKRQQKHKKRHWSLAVAANAELDREAMAQFGLVLRCVDFPGQNRGELALLISLLDQNDNRPMLSWAHQAQSMLAVPAKDWPQGTAISRFWARDRDIGENGRVQLALSGLASEFFRLDPESGVLSPAEDHSLASLAQMLAGEPLELEVTARDGGRPPLSSSVKVRILLEEPMAEGAKSQLKLTWPDLDNGLVELAEDTPVGRKIGKAEASWAGAGRREEEGEGQEIHFRIRADPENGADEMLRIDPKIGDIFTTAEFDFEARRHWTFLVTAFSPLLDGQESSALLELQVRNVDEQRPYFLHSLEPSLAKPIFHWPSFDGRELLLGQVQAVDGDAPPFDRIFYRIVPKCSHPASLFSPFQNGLPLRVDSESGQIWAGANFPANVSAVLLCILASPSDQLDPLDSLPAQSLLRVHLLPALSPASNTAPIPAHLLRANNSHSLLEHRLALQRIPIQPLREGAASPRQLNVSLHSVQFTPYGQTMAQKIGSLEPMHALVAVDPDQGELRFDPAVIGALGEGFYQFGLAIRGDGEEQRAVIYRNIHFLEDSHRLRLVFNVSIHAVGANLDVFIGELETLLSNGSSSQGLRLIPSELARDGEKPMIRTSMCFHLWSPAEAILGMDQTIRLVSTNLPGQKANERLAAFYERNSLVNIEPCQPSLATGHPLSPSGPSSPMNGRSRELLLWSSAVGISLLLFLALIGYFCFVRSYREYLRRKSGGDLLPAADEISGDSSPFHNFLHNQCSSASVFSVPEFIQECRELAPGMTGRRRAIWHF